jgi:hypothetical protein
MDRRPARRCNSYRTGRLFGDYLTVWDIVNSNHSLGNPSAGAFAGPCTTGRRGWPAAPATTRGPAWLERQAKNEAGWRVKVGSNFSALGLECEWVAPPQWRFGNGKALKGPHHY